MRNHKGLPNLPINILWMTLWLLIIITFVIKQPGFIEADAIKYFHIAQNMLNNHNYWVPFFRGHEYSDKPPLLFWLFILGWKLVGIHRWWPQLLSISFTTGSILVTRFIAQQLWPQKRVVAQMVPIILIGCYYWICFAKEIRVDQMLTFFSLVSISALIATLYQHKAAWFLYALALGLGILSKGPVIFIFTLIPFIIIPLIIKPEQLNLKHWYLFFALSAIAGIAIALSWAIPAAIKGGSQYAVQIFFGQIAHRNHLHRAGHNIFYYVLRLPIWLLPWSLYIPFWKGLLKSHKLYDHWGHILCFTILIIGIVVFSLFGQKEAYYLYPLTPIFALLITNAIANEAAYSTNVQRRHQWHMAIFLLIIAITWFVLVSTPIAAVYHKHIKFYFLTEVSLYWPLTFLVLAILLLFYQTRTLWHQTILLLISMLAIQICWYFAIIPVFHRYNYNDQSMLQQLKYLGGKKATIAVMGPIKNYHVAQYLKIHHIEKLNLKNYHAWIIEHPNGWLVTASPCLLLSQLGKQKPALWFYSGDNVLVSLWQAKQLMSATAFNNHCFTRK